MKDLRYDIAMKTKAILLTILAAIAALAVVISGCGKAPTKTKKTVTTKTATPAELTVVGEWSLDNIMHQEPMVVKDISSTTNGTLFVAYVSSDSGQGPDRNGPPLEGKVQSVEGGGLVWQRQAEAHLSITGGAGIAEVWTAYSTKPLNAFDLIVTRNNDTGAVTNADNYTGGSGPDIANGMVFVQAITGANPTTPIGATAVAGTSQSSGKLGPLAVTLTTTGTNSIVAAVAVDWSQSTQRVLPAGQVIMHEVWQTPNGDNYWVQRIVGPVLQPSPVTLSIVGLENDSCNMAAVEILRK